MTALLLLTLILWRTGNPACPDRQDCLSSTVQIAPEFVTGRPIPTIDVIDDTSQLQSTEQWRGTPTIIAPLYSRCPLACPLIVKGLRRATAEAQATNYRVVLLSFDPRDTPADLRRFRERNGVPLAWETVVPRGNGARQLLDAIGYRYGDTNGLFTHPNAVVVLTPDLKTAKFLFGTSYEARQIDEALAIAAGRRDWLAQLGPWLLAALLFAAAMSAVSLWTAAARRRFPKRQHAAALQNQGPNTRT